MDARQILRSAGAALTPLTRMNAGHAVMKTVERVAAATLKSGTGTPIAALKGIAKSNAVRAALAGGPISKGGFGVAGGKKVLAAAWLAGNTGLTLIGAAILNPSRGRAASSEKIAYCTTCRTLLSSNADGELQDCPNCAPDDPAEA